jgi:hypothetical protein
MCGIAQMERVRVPTAFSFNPFEIKNLEWELPRLGNSRNVKMKQVTSLTQEQFAMEPIITHSSCATCLDKCWFLKRLRIMERSPEGWRE